jgi:hypothetical protein
MLEYLAIAGGAVGSGFRNFDLAHGIEAWLSDPESFGMTIAVMVVGALGIIWIVRRL